jgi:hypothetical protein
MAAMTAIGPCYRCGRPFEFDPKTVPSVPVDPQTGLPPDLGGDAGRAVNRPVCPGCCRAVNPARRRAGLALWSETDSLDNLKGQDRGQDF